MKKSYLSSLKSSELKAKKKKKKNCDFLKTHQDKKCNFF